jgi:phosphoribosylamine--glycine ligase
MGAYSSDELLPAGLRDTVISTIVEPTLRGLAADGIPYQGFLYVGLMLTKNGPKVLEFNCRLGDPEAQAIVARMDFDLAEVLEDVAARRLDPAKLRWKSGASVCVVLTSGGYPGKFEIGKRIEGLTSITKDTGVEVFQAGTRQERDSVITSGGRVLGVTAAGDSLEAALTMTYQAVAKIHFDGMHYRKDIGAQDGRVKAAGD